MIDPNLYPEKTMIGLIDRPEEYQDIGTKCIEGFRFKNTGRALVILSNNDEIDDNIHSEQELERFYDIIWDSNQSHQFPSLTKHLQAIKAFKLAN